MAEVRCPMCSKPNPEEADECSFCGARLKPLIVDDQSTEQPSGEQPSAGQPGQEEGVPDWLNRIRARAEEEAEPEEEPAEESDTDWLSRLRSVEPEEGGPPEELPDWLDEEGDAPEAEAEDDWLNRLRDTTAEEAEPSEDTEEPVESEEIEFEPATEARDESVSESDQQLRELIPDLDEQDETDGVEQPADELESTDWLEQDVDDSEVEEDFPDWFGEQVQEPDEAASFDFEAAADDEAAAAAEEAERPDWFDEFEQAAEAEPDEELAEPTSMAQESDEVEAFDDEALPDWLGEEDLEAADQFEPEPASEIEAEAAEPAPDQVGDEEPADVDWQEVDWEALAGDEDELEPMPEGLGAPPEEQEEDLPHVPALILDEEDEGAAGPVSDEFDLDAIELPDWLTEVDQEPGREPVEDQESGDLAPATIPNWLEAMRPVETFQPVVDIEPEEEKSVESVGPLAGLRGVLLAEPVVAKPRTSTSVGERLQVTERQYAQAEILKRIVEREDQERVGARATSRGLPLVRWLIGMVLILAVLVPPIIGFPQFQTPDVASSDLRPLLDVVNNVESGQAALVVFDYEPGYSAELEAVGSAMLYNLMARDVNIVTVSTRPTGPPLALNLIEEVGEPFAVENGRDYIHLGYLSGGPTAVQLFSVAPQAAILKGFMLPEEMDLNSGWEAPILRDVNRLSDFGLVAVVTAGTDNARIWAEQAHPWLADTPMVMVLSAGAEPMIRPYFESLDPQVDGILTGLPTAVYYEEQINNRAGQARGRWNTFGAGVLAVEIILAIGLVYGVVDWIIDRRRGSEQA